MLRDRLFYSDYWLRIRKYMFSFIEYEKLLELFEKIINYFRYFSKQHKNAIQLLLNPRLNDFNSNQ